MKKTKMKTCAKMRAERTDSVRHPLRTFPSNTKPQQRNGSIAEGADVPSLRFTPTAWAKLLYFRDHGQTEIGGFAVTSPADLLLVEEFVSVRQTATALSVSFDDEAVADYFEAQIDAGRRPEEFFRIWLHTHPGASADPSGIDEETFSRVFGGCDWAVMFILSRAGQTYARLRFGVGPGGALMIPVEVDYAQPFAASDQDGWTAEYEATVMAASLNSVEACCSVAVEDANHECAFTAEDWLDELEEMDLSERRLVMDELAFQPDLHESESEVMF